MTKQLASVTVKMITDRIWRAQPGGRSLIVPLAITTLSLSLASIVFQMPWRFKILNLLKRASLRGALSFTPSSTSGMLSTFHPPATKINVALHSDCSSDTLTDPVQVDLGSNPMDTFELRTRTENEMIAHWLAAWLMNRFKIYGIMECDTQVHLASKINEALKPNTGLNPHTAIVCASAFYSKALVDIFNLPEFDQEEMYTIPEKLGVEAECTCEAERLFKWWIIAMHLAKMWWDGEGYSSDIMLSWTAVSSPLYELMELRALQQFEFGTLLFSLELSDEDKWRAHIQKADDHLWNICSCSDDNAETDWEMYATVRRLLRDVMDVQRPSDSRPWVCEKICESPGPMSPSMSSGFVHSDLGSQRALVSKFSDSDDERNTESVCNSLLCSPACIPHSDLRVFFELDAADVKLARRNYPRSPCPSSIVPSITCLEERQSSFSDNSEGSSASGASEGLKRAVKVDYSAISHPFWDEDMKSGGEKCHHVWGNDVENGGYDGDDEDEVTSDSKAKFFI
ncbi:hypothetical protein VKT23_012179 [Stygiomarasmius scandens]|uniref:Uncharacterized protein n=1 Tax=Marasmiellus scandens TaxID=2682957 RepID=A0ABR1J748_9AGAR